MRLSPRHRPWAKSAGKTGEGSRCSPTKKSPLNMLIRKAISNCGTNHTPLWRRSPMGSTICNACGLYLKARNTSRPTNLKRPAPIPVSAVTPKSDVADDRQSLSPSATEHGPNGRAMYVSANQIPTGSCPGGGQCNGMGGADGCNGCPALNNRVSKTTQVPISQPPPRRTSHEPVANEDFTAETSQDDTSPRTVPRDSPPAPNTTNLVLSCQNCGTTITPLWRRDESGRTICNACGRNNFLFSLPVFLSSVFGPFDG